MYRYMYIIIYLRFKYNCLPRNHSFIKIDTKVLLYKFNKNLPIEKETLKVI